MMLRTQPLRAISSRPASAASHSVWKVASIAFVLCIAPIFVTAMDFPLKRMPLFTHVVDYEASWSPDSQRIVLISDRHGGMHVHIMAAGDTSSGSDMKQVTSGVAEDDSPAWSPDGRKIAFVSVRAGMSHIYVMDVDGTALHQVTNGNGQEIHPMWSADGSRILFNTTMFHEAKPSSDQSAAEPNRFIGEKTDDFMDLATIRPDGSDLRRITHGGGYTYASFSPDGQLILHRRQQEGRSQIFLMNSDGSNDHSLSGAFTSDGWPAWSPDGKRIVFSRHVGDRFQIFVMSRDGSDARQLTDADGEFTNPRWSPDGRRILCGRRLGGVSLALFDAPH
jgi:TolB protein